MDKHRLPGKPRRAPLRVAAYRNQRRACLSPVGRIPWSNKPAPTSRPFFRGERPDSEVWMRRLLLLIGLMILPARASAAATVDYLRDIKPVLKQRCFACHGGLK